MELDIGLALVSVQRPQDVAERLGGYTLAPVDMSGFGFVYMGRLLSMHDVAKAWGDYVGWVPAVRSGVVYEDELLSMSVTNLGQVFLFRVENRAENSVRLLFAEAVLVGPNGLSTQVETETVDVGRAPTVPAIPSHALADFLVVPSGGLDKGFYAACDDVPGTEIRLVLRVETQSVTREYTLRFEPQRAELVTITDSMFRKHWAEVGSVDWGDVSSGDFTSVEDSRTQCWPNRELP